MYCIRITGKRHRTASQARSSTASAASRRHCAVAQHCHYEMGERLNSLRRDGASRRSSENIYIVIFLRLAPSEYNHNPSTMSTDYSQETSACKQAYVSFQKTAGRDATIRFPPYYFAIIYIYNSNNQCQIM